MSLRESACRKFQANIFNKSKCQNCFKPREVHLLSDEDFNQAKPIYGGWLLLAPDGTNFDNPMHRSRKWQRRFFILYEHGLLRYALDEMPSTLAQGTINMNQCTDVVDGESRTGQKFSLCILTPDKESYIRAETKDIINGWQEALIVYPRTNKQNQKKKRKVEPATPQEPGPAKVAVTSSSSVGGVGSTPCLPSSIAQAERVPPSRASLWQEERWNRQVSPTIPTSRSASCLSEDTTSLGSGGRKVRVESGYFSLEKPKSELSPEPATSPPLQSLPLSSRRSQVIERFEQQELQALEHMETASSSVEPIHPPTTSSTNQRQGRSDRRHLSQKQDMSLDVGRDRPAPDVSTSSLANLRRAKSLDRRATESSMTPDLLNFKKGWMTKLYEDGLWKKHWFVLTDQSLRYYRDSTAEEAADLDGEIDLSLCHDVTEYAVQRNYGFQIHSKEGVVTLSAMTSGIRRNWIQAIMKNVRPTVAPDVTRKNVYLKLSVLKPSSSLQDERGRLQTTPDLTSQPSVPSSRSSQSPETKAQPPCDLTRGSMGSEQRRSRVRDRRRDGRSKTFDWAEFQKTQQQEASNNLSGEAVEVREPVNVSSTSSSSSSSTSSSSSSSSAASSPTSSPQTSSSLTAAPNRRLGCLDALDGHEVIDGHPNQGQGDWGQQHHSSSTPPPPPASALVRAQGVEQAPSSMEVDCSRAQNQKELPEPKGHNVQVEIEQHWHQVETTPLREEKQVPIASPSPHAGTTPPSSGERAPPHERMVLLDKELGMTRKELIRLQEQNSLLRDQLQDARGRAQSAREGYVLQATCERGFAAMEETHQKVIDDLQRQHQREISKLLEERERLLAEETAATIAAIEAMKNAHREELEKTQRSQLSGVSADIDELRSQYEEELQSIHRELEVLSEQYSQKCLENAHLAQALQAERQALLQCQRENQELHTHNQELNNRLAEEITRMRSCFSGDTATSPLTQGKDLYELEVLLRIKESEIQYLKQEISSLKDELQTALREKKYASDKYKGIYTELSIVKAKADCDIIKLREKLAAATEALGERAADGSAMGPGYDIMKSKSNPDFLKNERSRQSRGVRSKSLKEGLTVQERMKLFEAKDSRKI